MPFFTKNPEVVVRYEPFCPPRAIPVWVSVWVKNVVSEWSSPIRHPKAKSASQSKVS